MPVSAHRLALLTAGPCFAVALIVMQPQMTALAGLSGPGSFLASLAAEPEAWLNGHLILLVAALLYLLAAQGIGRLIEPTRPVTAALISLPLVLGAALLCGNFALDLVYGALASGLPADAAQTARAAMLGADGLQLIFATAGPGLFLLGMALIAGLALITGWLPRLAGLAILAGWAFILGLNGAFPYAEAIGHAIVGLGFIRIGLMPAPVQSARQ
ncbi:hypothetical protein [uncultured Maricaulis sp.]|uniref:hypothetical protein n=1 Tax=uncultured Maricaulis sp. TaxID=174710 RepID=UPI00261E6D86|nr:hypothetical protein [uncultured Maricaulis sp.]